VRRRSELWCAALLATALVLLRSAVLIFWERAFNSDQAVTGLMAKHLSEFRAFPLFFYGQNYMLGVQSWIAVPFFWIGGPTVAMLRLPLVLINAGVAVALIVILSRFGLRPLLSLVAVLPLVVTTPIVSEALLETIGASVEPFAYVLILWALRGSPGWWGAIFCIGSLHREFVLFVAPALALAQWREGKWWTRRQAAVAAASFAAVWVVVDLLKRTVNSYGPPGGEHATGSLALQSQQIARWLSFDPGPYLDRLRQAVTVALPDMLGGRTHSLSAYGVLGGVEAGSALAGAALAGALVLCVARLVIPRRTSTGGSEADAFVLYLTAIALQTLLAYGLNSGIVAADPPIVRYLLFTLLLPVAVLAWFFLRETGPALRAAVVALICSWAALTFTDDIRLLHQYRRAPPADPHREIADYLTGHGIGFARAGYWDAYVITFLSGERVIVASTEKVRISSYQSLVERNSADAVTLRRRPCAEGVVVSAWCVQKP
jgi:hypothetical protein